MINEKLQLENLKNRTEEIILKVKNLISLKASLNLEEDVVLSLNEIVEDNIDFLSTIDSKINNL